MQLFTSLLAMVALLGAIGIVVLRLLARSVPAARDLLHAIGAVSLGLAFAVAASAFAGSMYFSQVEGYTPCLYCWYQRICMFPQTVILLVAALRNDRAVKFTAVPLSVIGLALSTYHVGLERSWFTESSSCDPSVPCSAPWFEQWGFVTLAVMAFCGFAAIIALVTCPAPSDDDLVDDADSDPTPAPQLQEN